MKVFLGGWILFCAGLVALGWTFSFFGRLDSSFYWIATVLFVAGWSSLSAGAIQAVLNRKWNFRRLASLQLLLPGLFALSAVLLFAKGMTTPPFHDDGLCYRIPRAMNWIMEHRWHWIGAEDPRLDVLGTVSEWLTVPILLIFHSDQLVFLPNWICHLFLPGLIFSVWRKLGVSSRIAWLSMWLLPSGFCLALQAANTSNDSLGAFFLLAAFFFALKGGGSEKWSDFAFSILCMALASGVKLNLLSLALPWAIAVSAGWKILLSRPLRTLGTLLLAALISFVPTALFNCMNSSSWTGLAYVQSPPPWVNFLCNSFLILVQNLTPPMLAGPYAGPHQLSVIVGTPIGDLLERYSHLPAYYSQVPVEQAGLGFIVTITFALIFLASRRQPHLGGSLSLLSRRSLIFFGLWVAFLHYLLFVNSDQPARLICPYYLLLLPAFFVRRVPRPHLSWKFYKLIVGMAMCVGLYLALFFTENPFGDNLSYFNERRYWDERFLQEAHRVIPEKEKVVGMIRFYNQRETWLWKPYGTRKVVELPLSPNSVKARELGIDYLVVSNEVLVLDHQTIESWLAKEPWILVGSVVAGRDNTWYFVKSKK